MKLIEKAVKLENEIEKSIEKFEKDSDWKVSDVEVKKIDITTHADNTPRFLTHVNITITKK